jgi:hypothetical protein
MTLSALAKTFGGIVRPICFAVLRLITSSNFVGCSTGRSAGFVPFKSLSTKWPADPVFFGGIATLVSFAVFKLILDSNLIGCSITNSGGRGFCSQFLRFKASTSAKSCVLAAASLFLIKCSLESTPTG